MESALERVGFNTILGIDLSKNAMDGAVNSFWT
jgi:uncharacterized caspase-like protein